MQAMVLRTPPQHEGGRYSFALDPPCQEASPVVDPALRDQGGGWVGAEKPSPHPSLAGRA